MKRIIQVEIEGHYAYKKRTVFDWPEENIVALVGTIGAGKSTLMGIPIMALFNHNPDRPDESIYDAFPGDKGYISCTIETDKGSFKAERILNVKSRTMKSNLYLNDEDLGTETKDTYFQTILNDYIGMSKEMFMATVYHAQSKESHPENASDKERSSYMYELMPQLIEFRKDYEIIDKERLKTSKEVDKLNEEKKLLLKNFNTAEVESSVVKNFVFDYIEDSKEKIESHKSLIQSLKKDKDQKELEIDPINTEIARIKEIIDGEDDRVKEIDRLKESIETDTKEKADNQEKYDNNKIHLIDKKEQIEKAYEQYQSIEKQIAEIEKSIEVKSKKIDSIQKSIDTDRADAKQIIADHQSKLDELTKELRSKEKHKSDILNAIASIESKIEIQSNYVEKIESVPCDRGLKSSCSIYQEAFISVEESKVLKASLDTKRKEVELIDTVQIQNDIDMLNEQIKTINNQINEREIETQKEKQVIQSFIDKSKAEKEEIKKNSEKLEKVAKLYDRLKDAPDRMKELQASIDSCEKRLKQNNERLKELESKTRNIESEKITLSEFENKKNEIKKQIEEIENQISIEAKSMTILETELKAYQENKDKIESLTKQIEEKTDYLKDLILLKEAHGDKGAPILIMKSAGPEIAEIANMILPDDVSFTVDVSTEKYVKSRNAYVEHIDFAAIDKETGISKQIKSKSGGESSLASEAISLAMAIYNKKHNNVSMDVLFRDETAGNLDSQSKNKYMSMLKNAMELGGFRQLNYIVHDDSLTEIAECVIGVHKGSVKVYDDVYEFRSEVA